MSAKSNSIETILEDSARTESSKPSGKWVENIPTPCVSNHASSLIELSNGDLACTWFAGSQEGASDVDIYLSLKPAGQDHWEMARKISGDPQRSEQNPFLFEMKKGEVWLVHTAQLTRGCTAAEWRAKVERGEAQGHFTMQDTAFIRYWVSRDYCRSFEGPFMLFEKSGSFCRQPFVRLSNGDLILGMWYSVADGAEGESYGGDYAVVQISGDEGKTWTEYPVPGSRGRVHMSIVELSENHLAAFFRSRSADCIYRSESKDNGRSWSVPVRTELPNNNASIQAKKLQNGDIVMIYNHSGDPGRDPNKTCWPRFSRFPVTVAISRDGGLSWPWIRHIHPGDGWAGEANRHLNREFSYPSIMEGSDGNLHMSYTCDGRACIQYVRVDKRFIYGE